MDLVESLEREREEGEISIIKYIVYIYTLVFKNSKNDFSKCDLPFYKSRAHHENLLSPAIPSCIPTYHERSEPHSSSASCCLPHLSVSIGASSSNHGVV